MCAFLETETDEGLHHRDCPIVAILEPLPTLLRQSTRLNVNMLAPNCAFEHLNCRVVGAGQLLNYDRNVEHVARRLQLVIEGQDGLRCDRCAQGRNLAAALAALQPVDARPLADVVAVGRAALEKPFLEPVENRLLRAVLLAIRVACREADV